MPKRIAHLWLPVAVLALWLIAAGGCQTLSREQQLLIASESFATTLDYLSDQREAGKISDAEQKQIAYARTVTDKLLDDATAAIQAGEPWTFDRALRAANEAMGHLLRERLRLKQQEGQ